MATVLPEKQQEVFVFPRPFLFLFLEAATPVVCENDDPTVAETETESGSDGVVKKDHADDEDEGSDGGKYNTLLIADSDSKEDEDY